MQKIVIILTQAIENNSSSMIRCKNIINALVQIGYEVTCYCPNPDVKSVYYGEDKGINSCVRIERYGNARIFKVDANNSKEKKNLKKRFISVCYTLFKKVDVFGSSLQYLRYRKKIFKQIKEENHDILLTFSDPMTAHMIGIYCKKRLSIKYIQQWGDPLTTDTISKTALPVKVRYWIERKLLKPADRVCYVSPLTFDEQKRIFKKDATKMMFLPTPCIEYNKPSSEKNSRIRVGYYGSYNLVARDIRKLYNAACNVKECDFLFIGDSDIKLEPQENIQVINRITPNELEKYEEDTDVLVCLMNSKGNQVPGKVYHYAGSYKEILFIKDGEFGDVIEEFFSQFNRYTFVENDCEKIEAVLRQYVTNGVTERTPLAEFKAENIVRKLVNDI